MGCLSGFAGGFPGVGSGGFGPFPACFGSMWIGAGSWICAGLRCGVVALV